MHNIHLYFRKNYAFYYEEKRVKMNNAKNALIILESFTAANKARNYLRSLKIKATVEKSSTKGGGCSYGIKVSDEPEKVCRLLSVANIKCLKIIYNN